MFCAYGSDRDALAELGALLADFANSPEKVRGLLARAAELGFEFDD